MFGRAGRTSVFEGMFRAGDDDGDDEILIGLLVLGAQKKFRI